MLNLFTDVVWDMYEGADPGDAYHIEDETYEKIELTDKELNKVVYPYHDFIMVMHADDRGFDEEFETLYKNFSNALEAKYNSDKQTSIIYDFLELRREEFFKKETTFRELLQRISKGICYGQFNGLRQTNEYSYRFRTLNCPVFRINYST
jgi:hypothetical protein